MKYPIDKGQVVKSWCVEFTLRTEYRNTKGGDLLREYAGTRYKKVGLEAVGVEAVDQVRQRGMRAGVQGRIRGD